MLSPPARHLRVQPAGNPFAFNKDARPFYPRAERKQKKREMEKALGVGTVNITAWSSLKAEIEADAEWVGWVLGEKWYPHARAGRASPHYVMHSVCNAMPAER